MIENNDNIIIRFCEVLSVEDDTEGMRIKVKMPYEDEDITDINDLPYVFPLLPKMLHITPKVGECVLIILQNQGEYKGNRFFIGPVISQPYYMNFDPYEFSSRSMFDGSKIINPLPNPKRNPDNDGTLNDYDDISIIGRKNTDITLKDNEIRLRCGFKKNPEGKPIDTLYFNKNDMAYIQMKYNRMIDEKGKEYNSAINIVADKINLLSHDSNTFFNLNDKKDLISEEEMDKIMKNAHPIPYGDELINLLKELIRVFKNHTHPFAMDPPKLTQTDNESISKDLNSILSKSIKIN